MFVGNGLDRSGIDAVTAMINKIRIDITFIRANRNRQAGSLQSRFATLQHQTLIYTKNKIRLPRPREAEPHLIYILIKEPIVATTIFVLYSLFSAAKPHSPLSTLHSAAKPLILLK